MLNEVDFEEAKRKLGIKRYATKENCIDGCTNINALIESWINNGIKPDDNHKIFIFTPSDSWLGGSNGAAQQQIIKIRGQLYNINHNIWYAKKKGILTIPEFEPYISREYKKHTPEYEELKNQLGGFCQE